MNKTTVAIAGVTLASMVYFHVVPPIAQDPEYHLFADTRMLLGIPNFWNVVSNLPFVILGLLGMAGVGLNRTPGYLETLKPVYLVFFSGVFLTGLTSAYYHLNPSNPTLVWDRLSLTMIFMSAFASVWGEHLSVATGRKMLWPLVLAGMASVTYWYVTEALGQGDLRFYALAQFLPMVCIPIILICRRSRLTGVAYVWGLILAYTLAKTAEMMDRSAYDVLGGLSGHEIKHWLAATGIFIYYLAGFRRAEKSDDRTTIDPVCCYSNPNNG